MKEIFGEQSNGKMAKKITNVILVRQDFDILSMSVFTDWTQFIENILEEELKVKTYDFLKCTVCGEIFQDWLLSNKHTIQNDNFLKEIFEEESNGKLAKKSWMWFM